MLEAYKDIPLASWFLCLITSFIRHIMLRPNEDDLNPGPLKPPRKEDIIFGSGPDIMANACLNYMWSTDGLYTEGYRIGARTLANHVLEHYRNQDILIYPIIYLYRHHIELMLKRLIVVGAYILDRTTSETENRHLGKHFLHFLWEDFRLILTEVCKKAGWTPPSGADVEGATSYIHQLKAVDAEGEESRYPRSKKGEPHLKNLKHINIRVFAEAMERLADFIEGLEAGFDHLQDMKDEMRAEGLRYSDGY